MSACTAGIFMGGKMDIGKLVATGKTYEIKHPKTGEELGIRVMLVSLEDESMKKVRRAISDRASKLQLRGKILPATDQEKNWISLLFAAVRGWEWYGDVDFDGEKPAFTRENFERICEQLPWFRDQIDSEISEIANFISA